MHDNSLHNLVGKTINSLTYYNMTKDQDNPDIRFSVLFSDGSKFCIRKHSEKTSLIIKNTEYLDDLLQRCDLNGLTITRVDSNFVQQDHKKMFFSGDFHLIFHLDNNKRIGVKLTYYSMIKSFHHPKMILITSDFPPYFDYIIQSIEVPVGIESYS